MNNITLRELQKAEAKKRLAKLKVLPEVTKGIDDDCIFYSERQNKVYNAILYRIDERKELVKVIKEVEAEYKIFVYHVQLTHTEFGDSYAMLYVSSCMDEWVDDELDLDEGNSLAYVWCGDVKEFGYIGVEPSQGGVLRTA